MQDNAYIFEAIAGLALFAAGARVLATAARGGGKPARLLGNHLLLAGISYALYTAPLMFEAGALFEPITFAGRVTYGVSVYFALEFTRSVFRRNAAFVWIGVEGLLAHAGARRRARLGLCDPIVAHRYLLWSLFGITQVCCSLVIVPMYAGHEENLPFTLAADAALGALEALTATIAWLAFCTPRRYGDWIARRAAATALRGG